MPIGVDKICEDTSVSGDCRFSHVLNYYLHIHRLIHAFESSGWRQLRSYELRQFTDRGE